MYGCRLNRLLILLDWVYILGVSFAFLALRTGKLALGEACNEMKGWSYCGLMKTATLKPKSGLRL